MSAPKLGTLAELVASLAACAPQRWTEKRDALRGSRYVTRSRPGEQREGGDGVTVVWLR